MWSFFVWFKPLIGLLKSWKYLCQTYISHWNPSNHINTVYLLTIKKKLITKAFAKKKIKK